MVIDVFQAKRGVVLSYPIRTNLRTQSPVRRATLEELSRIGMLAALVHLATGTHPTLDALQNRAKRAAAGQSLEERTGSIANHLRQLHETALFILPGEQDDEPVLQEQSNQLGIQFTEHTPRVDRLPFINLPILLP